MSSPADIAHEKAVAEGREYYMDPTTGLLVMTELHHLNRGHCCTNGCRHCPYGNSNAD